MCYTTCVIKIAEHDYDGKYEIIQEKKNKWNVKNGFIIMLLNVENYIKRFNYMLHSSVVWIIFIVACG